MNENERNTTSKGLDFENIKAMAIENFNICKMLVKTPQTAFDSIYSKSELDSVQMAIVTLIAVLASLITGSGLLGSFSMIIAYPIGLFISAAILALLVLIGNGRVEYIKLVNIVSYTSILPAIAIAFSLVPVGGRLIGMAASVGALILNVLAIIQKAGADQKRVTLAVAIFIGIGLIGTIVVIAIASFGIISTGILGNIF